MARPEIKEMDEVWQALHALLGTLGFILREIQNDLINLRERSYGSRMLAGFKESRGCV